MNNPTDRMRAIRERLAKATEWDANTYRDVYANAPADLEYLLKHCDELRAALVEFKTQHVADLDCPVEAGTFCGCDKDVDNARISRALRGES